jgi:hypothetical protein
MNGNRSIERDGQREMDRERSMETNE